MWGAVDFELQTVLEVFHHRAIHIEADETEIETVTMIGIMVSVFVGTDDVTTELGHGGNVAALPRLGLRHEYVLQGGVTVGKSVVGGGRDLGFLCPEQAGKGEGQGAE